MHLNHNTFSQIRLDTRGMLDPKIYHELYRLAQGVKKNILEIGTFGGAATISLALGAPDGVKVVTVERYGDFMEKLYGSPDHYKEQLLAIFTKYGVSEKIHLHVGEPYSILNDEALSNGIGMLLIDADGAVDRDLGLFYDILSPNGPIVIDDYGDDFAALKFGLSSIGVDQKHRLTRLLTDYFEGRELIDRGKLMYDTYFCNKVSDTLFSKDQEEVMKIYRRLAWATAKPGTTAYINASRVIKGISPRFHLWLKSKIRRS